MSTSNKIDDLSPHPVLAKLASDGRGSGAPGERGAVALFGYIGVSVDAAHVRLHRSLEEPGLWLDIPREDVLHVAASADQLQPTTVWVKETSTLTRTWRETFAADQLSKPSNQSATVDESADTDGTAEMIPVNKGRLRMLVRSGLVPSTPSGEARISTGMCFAYCKGK